MHGWCVHSRASASIQGHPAIESFVISMEILQCRLRISPAIIAASAVEIDEPESFDFDPEIQDRFRPHAQQLVQRLELPFLDLERFLDGRPSQ